MSNTQQQTQPGQKPEGQKPPQPGNKQPGERSPQQGQDPSRPPRSPDETGGGGSQQPKQR
jgi:hypothetical protein